MPLVRGGVIHPRFTRQGEGQDVELMPLALVAPANRARYPARIFVGVAVLLNRPLDRMVTDAVRGVAIHPVDDPTALVALAQPRHRAAELRQRPRRLNAHLEDRPGPLCKREGGRALVVERLAGALPEEKDFAPGDEEGYPRIGCRIPLGDLAAIPRLAVEELGDFQGGGVPIQRDKEAVDLPAHRHIRDFERQRVGGQVQDVAGVPGGDKEFFAGIPTRTEGGREPVIGHRAPIDHGAGAVEFIECAATHGKTARPIAHESPTRPGGQGGEIRKAWRRIERGARLPPGLDDFRIEVHAHLARRQDGLARIRGADESGELSHPGKCCASVALPPIRSGTRAAPATPSE